MAHIVIFHTAKTEESGRRKVQLRSLSEQLGISMSDVLRRLIDYGFQQRVINEVFPAHSGKLDMEDN